MFRELKEERIAALREKFFLLVAAVMKIDSAIGLKPGVEVILEIRGDEIIISKPKIEGSYNRMLYCDTCSETEKNVNFKEIIDEEVAQRHAVC